MIVSTTKSKLRAALSMLFVISCGIASAQNATVSGTVADAETRELLAGALIVVPDTNASTITDAQGRYSLNIPNGGGTLSVSLLGYQTQNVKATGTSIDIWLETESFEVEEIVVVGTVMRKSDLTGAVSGVTAKVLSEKPVTTVNEALQGRVAGVFISQSAKPTDEASIRIRGINTINGSTEPIYVVDGLVMDSWYGGFSAVNLNDVASLEVLKDASATAIYGSRGSNGVVVITTKKGRVGEGRVSYDGWVGVQSFAHQPELMNTKQLYELRRTAYINGFNQLFPNGNSNYANVDAYISGVLDNPASSAVFAPYEREAYSQNKTYSWLDEVTRTGVQHNHVVSFSNGNESGSYYLSFGYMNNKGLMLNSSQDRYTGRINADQKIKPWLTVGTNTGFTRTLNGIVDGSNTNQNVWGIARGASPMLAIDPNVATINWRGEYDQNSFNPIRSLTIQDDETRNRLTSTNFINISPIKGLNFRSTLSIDYAQRQRNMYVPNNLQQSVARYGTQGQAWDNRDTRTSLQWDNSLSYETTFDDVHRLNTMVGTSASNTKTNWINGSATGFITNDLSYKNLGAGYKKDGDHRGLGSDWNEQALMSYIARANYSYAGRYLLTATARYDGSSKFAKGHQWGLFPSLSAAWNIAEESFMENQNIFDQLKLRAGFGVVGNQNIRDYAFMSLYNLNSGGNRTDGYTYSVGSDGYRATPDISWEKQQQWNLGLDMSFLRNRINFSIDAFYINNKDLLMTRDLPSTSGYSRTVENVGAIVNKGVEFALNANIIRNRDFEWNFSATFSVDKNEVTQLYDNLDHIYNLSGSQIQNTGNLFLGESRNTYYMYRSGGIAQESNRDVWGAIDFRNTQVNPGDLWVMDTSGDGQITEADRVLVGNSDPKFYGGFSTDLTWKGISLNAVFTYRYGSHSQGGWYDALIGSYGMSNASVDLLDSWTPQNIDAKFPRVITGVEGAGYSRYGTGSSDYSLWDTSFLRLSSLSLAYTFPNRITRPIGLSNLRVYTTGTNVFCLTPFKGYDPETGDGYPPTRMWTFGINLAF